MLDQKRANGRGSVYPRRDGKWVAAVTVAGKRVSRYAATEAEAEAALRGLLLKLGDGALALPSDVTVGEWAARWLAIVAADLRPSTLATYQRTLAPLTARLGAIRLDRLTALAITRAIAAEQQAGRGTRRLQMGYLALRLCLTRAVELGLIAANPIEQVKLPRHRPRPRDYWTVEQAGAFIRAGLASRGRWGPLYAFLAVTGLRISEALALTWGDVDWEGRRVAVTTALVWAGKEHAVLPPKTGAGRRVVSLPAVAMVALGRVREGAGEARLGAAIFRTGEGRPPRHDHFKHTLSTVCRPAGVPPVNIHGLRHVAAMLALQAVTDPYLVQRRLGHSRVTVTLGVYGYSKRDEAAVADALDGLLGGSG